MNYKKFFYLSFKIMSVILFLITSLLMYKATSNPTQLNMLGVVFGMLSAMYVKELSYDYEDCDEDYSD